MNLNQYDQKLLTPLKQNTEKYQPDQQEIQGYAKFVLGLDLTNDRQLIYLAEEALKAPLPEDWQACQYRSNINEIQSQQENQIVYRNKITKVISSQHPMDQYYRQKALQLKMIRQIYKVEPIHEDLMESSINFKKMQNSSLKKSNKAHVQSKLKLSKIKNQSDKLKNNSSINQSKSIQISQNNSDKSKLIMNCFDDLHRNITQQSVVYDDQLDNFSMITEREEEANKLQKQKKVKKIKISPKKQSKIKQKTQSNKFEQKKDSLIDQHRTMIQQLKKKLSKYHNQQFFLQLSNPQKRSYMNIQGLTLQQNECLKLLYEKLIKIKCQNKQMDAKIQEMTKLVKLKQQFY